jgi:hypothetical protein
MRRLAGASAACGLLVALAACAHAEPRTVVQRVLVPTPVPCRVALPARPSYAADTVSLDGTIFDLVQALLIDREQRKGHEVELEAAAKSCS